MSKLTWFLIAILACLSLCNAYKILVVFPYPGKSHSLLGDGHVKLLLEAGHEVTYITAFPKKDPQPNLHQVDISDTIGEFPHDAFSIEKILKKENTINSMSDILIVILDMLQKIYNNENLQKMLKDPDLKFDVIISEWMFSELPAGFAALYDCPYIWFFSYEPSWRVMSLVDEANHPAYNADTLSTNIHPFTFVQRVQELLTQTAGTVLTKLLFSSSENRIYEEAFGPIMAKKGKPLPPLDFMKYNASMLLASSHVSLGHMTRMPQNYKPIAGFHIDPKVKPLPEDLKKIMDNAKDGVIYFSMGSNLRSKDWPLEIKNGLMKMFGGLKQTVLWKLEEEVTNLPDNVHLLHWAPQHSILAHPNCVLFITHGGFLSSIETVHFGVPIIGIPIMGDQFLNIKRFVHLGVGKEVPLSYTLVEELKEAIGDVLNNPKYRKRVKELSQVYHDRVASPGAELVHWVEHVVRTRGAPHLRSPALLVPWYQKMYIDLLALIIVAILVAKITIKRVFLSKRTRREKKTN